MFSRPLPTAGYALTPGIGAIVHLSATEGAEINLVICAAGCAAVVFLIPAALVAERRRGSRGPQAGGAAPQLLDGSDGPEEAVHAALSAPCEPLQVGAASAVPSSPAPPDAAAAADDDTISSARVAVLLIAVYCAANLVTKGVLAGAEAQLAPAYAATFGPTRGPGGGGVSEDEAQQQDTAEFALGLGLAGLVSYAVVALKPKRRATFLDEAGTASTTSGSAAGDFHGASTAHAAAGTSVGGSGGSSILGRSARGGGRSCTAWSAWCTWAAVHADELDLALLLASLILSAVGALLLATQPLTLPLLAAGFALVWSVAAPVADVLSISLASTALTRIAPGSQAAAMGWLSAAGSVGRILWPLGAVWLGIRGSSVASAAACASSAAALVALYVRVPQLPGARLCARGGIAAAGGGGGSS